MFADVRDGRIVKPAVYFDLGGGIGEDPENKTVLTPMSHGHWAATIRLASAATAARLDPTEARCVFGLRVLIRALAHEDDVAPLDTSNPFQRSYQAALASASGLRHHHWAPPRDRPVEVSADAARIIAFYLPQFYPIPQNDAWWEPGFTEWNNVARAVPQFEGHHQPKLPGELGFYDLRVPDILARQVELAKRHGVSAFCFHYYWFGGQRLLERPLDMLASDPSLDLPFCLCWANENWTRRWDGRDDEVLIAQRHGPDDNRSIFADMLRYLRDPRYVTVDGKPVIIVYRPAIIPGIGDLVSLWRRLALDAGLSGLWLVATNAFGFEEPERTGFDAICEFPPHGLAAPDRWSDLALLNAAYAGTVHRYDEVASLAIDRLSARVPAATAYYPGVMPAWDNEARRTGRGLVFLDASPAAFADWLASAVSWSNRANGPGNNLVFVNAWNEWGEGAYLEPDRRHGHAFLRAVASVREDARTVSPDLLALQSTANPAGSRLVVCLHINHPEQVEACSACLDRLRRLADHDVIVSLPDRWSAADAQRVLNRFRPVRLVVTECRGRDIWPFIRAGRLADELGYVLACKLHGDAIGRAAELIDVAGEALTLLDADPEIGIAAAADHCRPARSRGDDRVRAVLDAADLGRATLEDYVAGATFFFRIEALRSLFALPFQVEDFGRELGAHGNTLAEAVERTIPTLAMSAGFKTATAG